MPNLRAYYRITRKAKVVQTYASDAHYWADVQPLKNDESEDTNEPVVSKVEIPILWGGKDRGVVCPPMVGTLCDLSYYDGDPNYPRISNFRWQNNGAPACEVGAFIIQADPSTYIKIDAEKNLIEVTPASASTKIGGNKDETIGGVWTIKAPKIIQEGNVQATGAGGGIGTTTVKAHTEQEGSLTILGHVQCSSLCIAGDLSYFGGMRRKERRGSLKFANIEPESKVFFSCLS
ncbi:baseplate assembly protein [Halodesulfovibrio sp. MK-HDV]|uniref:baseplate assembly protein n=1 Tax=Halodesulfovibrio sp. MK-HDV TaxID=2599925 RepID=UPI0020B12491|nr:baseplate assembly protein [Halodesulfovibrio sp. MK-HDV]